VGWPWVGRGWLWVGYGLAVGWPCFFPDLISTRFHPHTDFRRCAHDRTAKVADFTANPGQPTPLLNTQKNRSLRRKWPVLDLGFDPQSVPQPKQSHMTDNCKITDTSDRSDDSPARSAKLPARRGT
jgi:hypothetical protein